MPGQEIDLNGVISSLFPGDSEFVSSVVDKIDAVLTRADMHEWAELKRLDAHAAKHQRIASDHLLNLTCLLINRLCCLEEETNHGKRFKDILLDRMENFHNQCRDEVPQSVSRHRARFEYLHPYNARSYASILGLAGVVLTKSDEETCIELAKRIASNHNHWFNFSHIVEFLKSIIEVVNTNNLALDFSTSLTPSICLVISGMCGIRLGHSPAIEQTGVEPLVWLGSVLIDLLEVARNKTVVSSALSALASLNLGLQPGLARSVMNRVIGMLSEFFEVEDEILNFLICAIRHADVSEWHLINLEFASKLVLDRVIRGDTAGTARAEILALKWLRIMCYGPLLTICAGTLFCWRALLTLDSPVFDFVVKSAASDSAEKSIHAAELIRVLLARDSVFFTVFPKTSDVVLVPVIELLVSKRCNMYPLAAIMTRSFKVREARKACCYILLQALARNPVAVAQVLFGDVGEVEKKEGEFVITENFARVLLDANWEEEVDLTRNLGFFDEIDFNALNQQENTCLGNHSVVTLLGMNAMLETQMLFKLEIMCEQTDRPLIVNDRIEYWLFPDNVFSAFSRVPPSIYHTVSARLVALVTLFESSSTLTAQLLGLVESSTGIVLNNDLSKELVAIDALFLLLNTNASTKNTSSHVLENLEYLFALRVVEQCLEEPVNRGAILRFIQFRWINRFSILHSLISAPIASAVDVWKVASLLKIIAVELMVACELVDSDAEHVRNMRDFGSAFLIADLAKGHSAFVDYMRRAFHSLSCSADLLLSEEKQKTLIDPRLGDPEANSTCSAANGEILNRNSLTELVESVTAVILQWSFLTSESERFEILPFLIEAVEINTLNEFGKLCILTRFVPKLYSLLSGNGALAAFHLRTLKSLLGEINKCKNPRTKSGIIQTLCYAVMPFLGSDEMYMIEQDSLNPLIDTLISFASDTDDSDQVVDDSHLLALTVLESLISSRKSSSAIQFVKQITDEKYKQRLLKLVAKKGCLADIVTNILGIVEGEMLYKELEI